MFSVYTMREGSVFTFTLMLCSLLLPLRSPLSLNAQYWNPIFQTTEKTSSGPACHFTRTFLDVVKTLFEMRLNLKFIDIKFINQDKDKD